jgi:predicted DNA-binding transcriptional regulator AlpA
MSAEQQPSRSPTPRRLLNGKEAAFYCGVSPSTFARVCDVRPVMLGRDNESLRRFDIRDLDEWIESKKVANQNEPDSKVDLIDRLLTL